MTPYQFPIVKVEIKKSSSGRTWTWLRSCCSCCCCSCRTAWTSNDWFILAKHVKFEFRLGLDGCRFLHEEKNGDKSLEIVVSYVTRPLSLVESKTLDATIRREGSLFTLLTFCNTIFSCSLILKENIRCVHLPVFY